MCLFSRPYGYLVYLAEAAGWGCSHPNLPANVALAGSRQADVCNVASWQTSPPLTKAEVRRCPLGPLRGLVAKAEGRERTQEVCWQQACFPIQGRTPGSSPHKSANAAFGVSPNPAPDMSRLGAQPMCIARRNQNTMFVCWVSTFWLSPEPLCIHSEGNFVS